MCNAIRPCWPWLILTIIAAWTMPASGEDKDQDTASKQAPAPASDKAGRDAKAPATDVTKEWAVDWVDNRGAFRRKYQETIFIQIKQEGKQISGTAIDPDLIPATVQGTVEDGKIKFTCSPKRHSLPFRPPPGASTFEGEITSDKTMKGNWAWNRSKGTWTARRTPHGEERTIKITQDTKLKLMLTSEEYDLFYARKEGDDDAAKQTSQVGDQFEISITPDSLVEYHSMYLDRANRKKSANPAEAKQYFSICRKIEATLRQGGYPWSLDEQSRTVKPPAVEAMK